MPTTRTPGLAVVVSGPSGSGKTTVCRLLEERYGYDLSVSATTRPPRPGERDGAAYRFITREAFAEGVRNGEFLEHSEHFEHLYGTPRIPIEEALAAGRVVLLEIDVNGAAQVRKRLPEACCIFLRAPDADETEKRLRQRRSDREGAVQARLKRGDMEMAMKIGYDCEVVNDSLDATVKKVHDVIEAEARKRNGR